MDLKEKLALAKKEREGKEMPTVVTNAPDIGDNVQQFGDELNKGVFKGTAMAIPVDLDTERIRDLELRVAILESQLGASGRVPQKPSLDDLVDYVKDKYEINLTLSKTAMRQLKNLAHSTMSKDEKLAWINLMRMQSHFPRVVAWIWEMVFV